MPNRPMRDLSRYELFGWDYAEINPLEEREAAWYLSWARRVGGPVLVLACGGGRLAARLAEDGHEVTGIDLSETMLGIARANVAKLPAPARRRVRLIRGDMASFELPERFGLVMIPDNSFRELSTRRQLLQCLRTVRRHLRADGRLLIVERRFRAEMYPGGERRFDWSPPKRDPRTGEQVRRLGRIRLHTDHRRLSGVFEYEVSGADGARRIVRCPWSAPVLGLEEYLALFRRAGFATEVFADYGSAPNGCDGNLWCFACSRG